MKYFKRLLIALIISGAGFYATEYWYNTKMQGMSSGGKREYIAQLSAHVNEVQRKPLARVIWENLSEGERLYAGESIRTNSDSEASITFTKTGAVIQLEPDSQVVLENNEDGLALNFLKGNLYVKGGKGGATGLTLKTGDKTIALNNADLSLSKSKKGQVDLQVFKGNAELSQNGKTVNLNENNSGVLTETGIKQATNIIKVISPLPGEPVFTNPRKRTPVTFKWEKLPPGYTVYLEQGKKRNKMKKVPNASAQGDSGSLDVRLSKLGKFYWRLVAIPNKADLAELSSKTLPSQLMAKAAPIPLNPEENTKVVLKTETPNVEFKWVNQTQFKYFFIEVAKDKDLKSMHEKQKIEEGASTSYTMNFKESGAYFWRVTGYLDIQGKVEPLSSPIQKFSLQIGVNLIPPVLRSPMAKQSVPYHKAQQDGVFLTWDPVPGIKKYKVTVNSLSNKTDEPLFEKETFTSPLKLKDLTAGSYQWQVTSVGPKGKLSKSSEQRTFKVEEIPSLDWAEGNEPSEFFYVTDKPYIRAQWMSFKSKQPLSWRARYAPKGELSKDTEWIYTKNTYIRKWVESDGEYDVEVEAIDASKKVIARSSIKTIHVQAKPLLPAPQFAENMPEIIKSNRRGNVTLNWKPVDGATSYEITIKDQAGKILKQTKAKRSVASLQKLKPGKYKLTVKAIDEHKRASDESVAKDLSVPKTSNIAAPKVNKIKVN